MQLWASQKKRGWTQVVGLVPRRVTGIASKRMRLDSFAGNSYKLYTCVTVAGARDESSTAGSVRV